MNIPPGFRSQASQSTVGSKTLGPRQNLTSEIPSGLSEWFSYAGIYPQSPNGIRAVCRCGEVASFDGFGANYFVVLEIVVILCASAYVNECHAKP